MYLNINLLCFGVVATQLREPPARTAMAVASAAPAVSEEAASAALAVSAAPAVSEEAASAPAAQVAPVASVAVPVVPADRVR